MERDWLARMRKEQKRTQDEIAEAADVAQGYYSDIERGNKNPSPAAAKRIGAVLGFDWTRFYEDAEGASA